jgi:hypothetical protein
MEERKMKSENGKLEILTFGEFSRKVGTTPSTTLRDFDTWSRYVEVHKDSPEYEAMLKRKKERLE